MKCIHKDLTRAGIIMLQQEMSRHANPFEREARFASHVHIYDGERYRDAKFSIKNVVQERIPRIIIIVAIAAKSFLIEEHPVE